MYATAPINDLHALTYDALDRLGDIEQKVWTEAEIQLYLQDGHNEFMRRTRCLFDIHVIENLPPTANWTTDLEKYFALQRSGWGLTDEPFHYTGSEQNFGTGGNPGGSYAGPAGATNAEQAALSSEDMPTRVPGGTLPETTLEVLGVLYDERYIRGEGSQHARYLDVNYQTREGDPQYFTLDGDGINYLRLVPGASGDAVYDSVDGSWGTRTYTDDTDCTVVTTEVSGATTGGFGILRHVTGDFPAGGPWGTPTRRHPSAGNIQVEMLRLGRPLTTHSSELPRAYLKYVVFWAMAQALRRDGPGQDEELSQHFADRFDMGVYRLTKHVNLMATERVGRFGQPTPIPAFGGLGDPQAPYPYGEPR